MLYVFLVDTGKMMTFDMNHAVESVKNLKEVIAQRCHVPADKQVLLISGGESLQLSASVGKYSAGTDTNPIFLFNKASIESEALSRSGDQSLLSDDDMEDGVEEVLNLPPSYNTVVTRTQLAQGFYDRARRETKACESLVHDQHLQQQGWAAVVANLEDTTAAFRNSAATFEQSFVEFLRNKPQHTALLESFERDLELLSKIPVLPALLSAKPMEETSTFMLLDWIHSQDSQTTLDKVAAQCVQTLKQLNDDTLEKVKADVESTLASVDNATMKEIKGLEERLFGLEDLMHKAQRLVQDQQELAQAFAQNQSRASHLKDPSIFPDLCSSHIKQLKMMLANHQQLRDIRRRCTAAKNELSGNLNSRLRWIIYVQKAIHEVNLRMIYYSETAKRLCRHLEVFRQVHLAPHVYLHAVAEVVRRRNFSLHFLEWAGSLSSHCQKLHQDEVETRKAFNSQFSKHFLRTLFPGMQDLPPPFATRNPKPFDDHLPPLAPEDLELLRNTLPNLPELSDLLVSVLLPAFPEVPFRLPCGSADAHPGSAGEASSEMRSCGPSSQCEMRSPDPDAVKASTLQASQSGSQEGRADCSESDDHERTPKLAESDDEFEEVCETPSSMARPEETPLDVTRQDAAVLSPDSLGHASQDFMTADFYIDESMPSSYSDSNGVAATSGTAPASLARCPQDILTAELQRQLEEKTAALSSAQRDLEQERAQRQELKRRLCSLREVAAAVCASSRSDAASLRQDLQAACQMLSDHACLMGSAVDDALQALLARAERDQAQAVAAEEERVRRECRSSDEELRHQLEVERLKLEDAHREVHLYQQQLQQLSQLVDSLRHDSALALTSLRSSLQQEHESVLAKMVLEHELEQEATLERLRAFQKSHEEEIQDLNECICERDRQIQMLFVEQQGLENQLSTNYMLDKEELLAQCQRECAIREQRVRDRLTALHQQEFDRLQESHEQAIRKARDDARLELQREWEEAQSKEKDSIEDVIDTASDDADRHAGELEALRRGYEEQIACMKANMEATHRRLLEEAISRAVQEKEEEVSRLQSRYNELLEQNKGLGGTTDSLEQQDNNPSTELVSQMQLSVSCSLSDDPNGISMTESMVRLPQQADPVLELRNQLMYKEQEVSRLQQKVMAMSDTFGAQPPSLPTDKVSVLTCSAGDVVLLCFDEGHQNYVLFVLGPVLHFLHTDCLESLGLQKAPGAIRKGWVLAEVLEKEYCQARKSLNRYRVPAGTRFYRVKCKLWDKEAAMRREHQRRHSLRGLTTGASMFSEESSTAAGGSASGEPFCPQDAPPQFPVP